MQQDRQPELQKGSQRLSPNTVKIAQLVATLLSHYWTANENPALRKAQAADWLKDLSEFEAVIVEKACDTWRQQNAKRPTPNNIRHLCNEIKPVLPREPYLPAWQREAHAKGWLPIPAADVVRDGWDSIPNEYLTDAERELGNQSRQKRLADAGFVRDEKGNFHRVSDMAKEALDNFGVEPAREIPAP